MREVNGGRLMKKTLWTFRIWNGSVAERKYLSHSFVALVGGGGGGFPVLRNFIIDIVYQFLTALGSLLVVSEWEFFFASF